MMEFDKRTLENLLFPIFSNKEALKALGLKFYDPQPRDQGNSRLFKTNLLSDYSLTEFGFDVITVTKFYPNCFVGVLKKDFLTPANILTVHKNFTTPYYIDHNKIFYFDPVLNVEICVCGGLESFITVKRNMAETNLFQ